MPKAAIETKKRMLITFPHFSKTKFSTYPKTIPSLYPDQTEIYSGPFRGRIKLCPRQYPDIPKTPPCYFRFLDFSMLFGFFGCHR